MKTRDITTAGLLIALQTVTLLLVYIVPTIKLALLFAVSLYSGILLRVGIKRLSILISFIITGAIVVFFINIVEITVLYISFFGWYPLLHEGTKKYPKIKKQIVRWIGFLLSGALIYIAVSFVISFELNYAVYVYIILFAVAFLAMQILFELCVKEFIKKSGIKAENGKIMFGKQSKY